MGREEGGRRPGSRGDRDLGVTFLMHPGRVSYLEIYNESLFDLLSTLPYVGPSVTPMTIVENPQGVFIKGLSVHLTSQEEDAFSLLFEVR